ncbi:MAG: recombinase family protein [Holophagales bacterium]|jgi:DNA invertase Pin-like site-specific DNA recombinase|nr:recombinase family protein [Holophagales bacterium]
MMDNGCGYLIDSGVKALRLQMGLDAEPKNPARVALYARVPESRLAQSLGFQLKCLRLAAERLGMEVVLEAAEVAPDAADAMPMRDALPEQSIHVGFDAVMVTRVDRFGSSVGDTFKAWRALEMAGANFISLFEGLDYSRPHGKLAAHSLATASDFEKGLIDEWRTAGLRAAAGGVKHGWPGSPKDGVERDIALALGRVVKQTNLARLCKLCHGAVSAIGQAIRRPWQQETARPLDGPQLRSDRNYRPTPKPLERGAGGGPIVAEESLPAPEKPHARFGAEPLFTRSRRAS